MHKFSLIRNTVDKLLRFFQLKFFSTSHKARFILFFGKHQLPDSLSHDFTFKVPSTVSVDIIFTLNSL